MRKISTVMIVDDSEIDHIAARYAIEDYNTSIKVIAAFDGQEALDILAASEISIDVIFLDINMPGMDGHEFLDEYGKREQQGPVVVMLTSSSQEEDTEKSTAYPFVREYIIKPLDLEGLKSLVASLD